VGQVIDITSSAVFRARADARNPAWIVVALIGLAWFLSGER